MKKWGWAILLAAMMMIVSILPVTVFAAGDPVQIVETGTAYATVQAAVTAAANGQTIRLNADCNENVSIPTGKTVTIDLNGNVLKGTGSGSVIRVQGTLTLKDNTAGTGKVTGGTGSLRATDGQTQGGGVCIDKGGTFNMNGGNIVGNSATYGGGGVFIDEGGTFNMYGGVIADNKADCTVTTNSGGGGVFVLNKNTAKFNMYGGKIIGNTVTTGRGGGVFAGSYSVVTISGGEIAYNYANDTNATEHGGGGVMTNGSFTMTGGSIHHNATASGEGAGVYSYQTNRGPRTLGGTAKIIDNFKGGTISGNINDGYSLSGGTKSNLFVAKASNNNYTLITISTVTLPVTDGDNKMNVGVAMTGDTGVFTDTTATKPEYLKCFTSDKDGLTVYRRGDNTLWLQTDWGALGNELSTAAPKTMTKLVGSDDKSLFTVSGIGVADSPYKITLDQNFTAVTGDTELTVKGTKTLDLAGYTLDANSICRVMHLNQSDAKLTLEDSSTNGTGKITGGANANTGGGVLVNNGSTFTMNGGTITGNKVNVQGGGVYVFSGTFNMNGGTITGNEAVNYGGGVSINSNMAFNMTGGKITGNKATGSESQGGGVYNNTSGNFAMTGGEISENSAVYGGGVLNWGALTLGGTAQITGNLKPDGTTVNNLYLTSGTTVTLGDGTTGKPKPANGMKVGVTLQTVTGAFTGTAAAGDTAYFFSDDTAYADKHVTNHLELVEAHKITVDSVNANGSIEVQSSAYETETVTVTVTPNTSYMLTPDSLKAYKTGDTNTPVTLTQDATDKTKYTFAMPDHDVTVTAVFETPWQMLQNALNGTVTTSIPGFVDISGNTVKLLTNFKAATVDKSLTIEIGTTKTLDLNGYEINANGISFSKAVVISVDNDASLTITDGSMGKAGKIDGGGKLRGINCAGTVVMDSGTITNCKVDRGAGVFVTGSGSFTMNGGEISANTSTNASFGGGGIGMDGGTLVLSAGKITGNSGTKGGGVYVLGGNATIQGTVEISGNSGTNGGGVYVDNKGVCTMIGGTIQGNTASGNGGGVSDFGSFTIGGNAQITGNKKGTGSSAVNNNLHLERGKTVAIATGANAPSGASVGVTV